jgi:CzcA family heavy metal efflux pump
MLQAIVNFSLRFRGIVVALACILLGYGVFELRTAKLDVFPDFVQPQVVVQTECPGLSPDHVEVLVTQPLEAAINGLGEMESLRSETIEGLSVITAVFKEKSDVFRARQMLGEILSETAGKLPSSVKTPRMTPLTSSTMDLLKIGLVSTNLSPMALRTFADWTLKPRLLAVPGVAKCSTFGGQVLQLQVQVEPRQLLAHAITISDVLAAVRQATGIIGAGFVENDNQRITLQTTQSAITPEVVADLVVLSTNGFSLRLRDVARVVEGAEPKFGDCLIQGRRGVLMTMSSQYGANTLEVTRALEVALKDMQPTFKKAGIQLFDRLHRPATFIEVALHNMRSSLALGAVLVAITLFLLLGSVRTAIISLTAIPLSLMTALLVLDRFGITINTITLGGLAIALGEVVDDSIIDVENIFRRLRESGSRNSPDIFGIILAASLEVRTSVVFATFIVALVFLPVLTLTGLQGSFFRPLGISYILAIMASLLVALTVTPALSFLLFGKGPKKREDPWLPRKFKHFYGGILRRISAWPRLTILIVAILCVAALFRLPFVGEEFLPEFREGHYVISLSTAAGTSLPEMLRLGEKISKALLQHTNVSTVEQQIGRAELGEDPWGPHKCEFHVELKSLDGELQEQTGKDIDAILKKFPGIHYEVLTFLGDRIGETISGETAPVVVNVFGDDLDVIEAKAREVAAVIENVKGNSDVKVKAVPGAPRMVARLNSMKLAQYGFRPLEVMQAVETAYQGTVVGQYYKGSQVADIDVILDTTLRQNPEALGNLLIESSGGVRMPLKQLADVFETDSRFTIYHEGGRRRQTVTCKTEGRDVTSFVAEAKQAVAAKVNFPAGTYALFSGAAQAQEQGRNQLLLHSAIAAVGIIMLLTVVFGNWRNLMLVLVNVPFALVGGVLAIWIMGLFDPESAALNMGSLVGFVTLFGITTRNSIMLISHYEHLVTQEGMTWGPEAAFRGASERLMPILITAIVTGLGLLPLAIGSGEAGREIEGPMAVVILGGLITSTALNLLVLPTLSLRYGRFAKPS